MDRGYVLRSDDGGRTWQRVWQGGGVIDLLPVRGCAGAVMIQAMEANPEADNAWEPRVYRSGDGGINWQRLGFGGILIRESSAPGVVYRTEWRLEKFGDRYLKTGYRLKRSSDGGATWEEVAWSGVPDEPWLFVPVTVGGEARLLLQGDRTYYYRRWTLAPLPQGFAERRRQLEAMVTEALSWGLDDGMNLTYAAGQNALYVSGFNSGLYRLELGLPVVPLDPGRNRAEIPGHRAVAGPALRGGPHPGGRTHTRPRGEGVGLDRPVRGAAAGRTRRRPPGAHGTPVYAAPPAYPRPKRAGGGGG
ncbi:MAG: exo-alpha-sialidase [Clostridia bacterium]|nr:exo-alpha-sialidase [Clostridia bacterium]